MGVRKDEEGVVHCSAESITTRWTESWWLYPLRWHIILLEL